MQKRPSDPAAPPRPFRAMVLAAGAFALLGGMISFAGWPLDLPRATDWLGTGVSIQPNAALLITLAGAAILLLQIGFDRAVLAIGGLIAFIGLLTLTQYIVGADFGFNHQLLFGREWGQSTTMTRGRVGPPASSSFVLIGTCLAILALSQRGRSAAVAARRIVPACGLIVCTFMVFSLVGYIFGARQFYTVPWLSAIALQTSSMIMGLAIALIAAVPERQPLLLLRERTGAAMLGRLVLPLLIILPPLVSWLRTQGETRRLYDPGTGRALSVIGLILGPVALMWWALKVLRRHERSLRESESRLAAALDERTRELTEANERHRRTEAMALLGSLSSGIAHDLGNLLLPLRARLDVLPRAEIPQPLHPELEAIARSVGYIGDLATRLRQTMSDVVREQPGTSAEAIDLAGWRRESEAFLQHIPPAAIALECDVPAGLPAVRVSKVALTQAVYNLMQNSVKAMRRSATGERIALRAWTLETPAEGGGGGGNGNTSAWVQIVVEDDGPGMPPEILARCTEPRFTTDGETGGLGLGLALVKAFVESSGGEIEVTSPRRDGRRGTTVIMRLPACPADPPDAPEPPDSPHASAHPPVPASSIHEPKPTVRNTHSPV